MEKDIKTIKISRKMLIKNERSVFSRFCLPMLTFISFVWLNLYSTLTEINVVNLDYELFGSVDTYVFLSVLLAGLFDYLIFELLFFIYRLFLGFSIYSFMIPKNVMIDKFRIWYILRNVVLGIIFNLRFFFPYISTYLCVFELILNFGFIICLYFALAKNYVEPLVAQFVFKTLVIPVILYEVYVVIKLMVGVL